MLNYTHTFSEIISKPITSAIVFNGEKRAETNVLWDTGADKTFISVDAANVIKPKVIEHGFVTLGDGHIVPADLCLINILLFDENGNHMNANGIEAAIVDNIKPDLIIGMSFLREGTFILENLNKKYTRLTFRVEETK